MPGIEKSMTVIPDSITVDKLMMAIGVVPEYRSGSLTSLRTSRVVDIQRRQFGRFCNVSPRFDFRVWCRGPYPFDEPRPFRLRLRQPSVCDVVFVAALELERRKKKRGDGGSNFRQRFSRCRSAGLQGAEIP